MSILVARVKISPTGPGLNASTFEPLISGVLPSGSKIRKVTEEPLAFGVFTVYSDIEFEDNPGALDVIEECLNKLEQVSDCLL